MNKEIKEILDKLKDTADTSFFAICGTKEELENMPKSISKALRITDKHAKLLLDYITNLQEDNELRQQDINNLAYQLAKEKEIKRKAIEYIKENQEEEYVTGNPMLSYWAIDNLLNILQNGSDSQ